LAEWSTQHVLIYFIVSETESILNTFIFCRRKGTSPLMRCYSKFFFNLSSFRRHWHTMWCPSLLLLFDMDLPQWPSMKSYVILEVFRIEIEQIIFSRFRNGTKKNSGIIFFSFPEVDNILWSGRFYRAVGKGETNNIFWSHMLWQETKPNKICCCCGIYIFGYFKST
jgi:hypothetical protein